MFTRLCARSINASRRPPPYAVAIAAGGILATGSGPEGRGGRRAGRALACARPAGSYCVGLTIGARVATLRLTSDIGANGMEISNGNCTEISMKLVPEISVMLTSSSVS
jgi:hypothetical protein